jgi:membrane fusion protein, multidrug efflux system
MNTLVSRLASAATPVAALPWSHRMAAVMSVLAIAAGLAGAAPSARAETLAAAVAQPGPTNRLSAYDGVVEAVRQTVIAAQVSAAVVDIKVKVGDRVTAGQLLLRLDARAADQGAAAGDAQVRAARAAQDVATRAFARQQQLAADRFISAAALDQAQAAFRAAQAQAEAQIAQAAATRTEAGFYVVRAPYAGIVAEVPVTLGDMALPGRPLVTLYDPAVMRVVASVPQSAAAALGDGSAVRVELPSQSAGQPALSVPQQVQVLPAADASTHTVTVRANLAPGAVGAMPGQFARVWAPSSAAATASGSPWVPAQAIVRRAEMTGLYVLNDKGQPLLRQVRLGRTDGDQVEVLTGLSPRERVATDAQAATRQTAGLQP